MTNNLRTVLNKYREIVSFAVIGFINTSADFGVFSFLLFISPAINKEYAQAVGYVTGLVCSFFLNKYVTFKNNINGMRQGVLFLLCNGVTLVAGMLLMHLFYGIMGMQEHMAKLFLITPITMVINFLSYKYIVFRKTD